jgi:hypothetical protein
LTAKLDTEEGSLYGITTSRKDTKKEKKDKKGVLLPFMRPQTSLLLDLPVRVSDLFRLHGREHVGHDL